MNGLDARRPAVPSQVTRCAALSFRGSGGLSASVHCFRRSVASSDSTRLSSALRNVVTRGSFIFGVYQAPRVTSSTIDVGYRGPSHEKKRPRRTFHLDFGSFVSIPRHRLPKKR